MRKINISTRTFPNTFALVDSDCFNFLNQWKWHRDNGYAFRREYYKDVNGVKKYRNIYMHKLIIECPFNKTVDHKNGNGLDNRRKNLRVASWKENMQNRRTKKSHLGLKGVYFSKSGKRIKRWMASIVVDKKDVYLGRFLSRQEAAKAYNQAAIKYFGNFSYLNKI